MSGVTEDSQALSSAAASAPLQCNSHVERGCVTVGMEKANTALVVLWE